MNDIEKILSLINETTTAGAIAPVSNSMHEVNKRVEDKEQSIIEYGNWENSSLVTNKKLKEKKKTNKIVKSIYGENAEGKSILENAYNEEKLSEQDLIINPSSISKLSKELVNKHDNYTDHEIEMAKNNLYQASKNALTIFNMIKDIPENVGLEAWVQEKIIKASDYLNIVAEHLEGKKLNHADSNAMFSESQQPKVRKYTKKRADDSVMARWEVLNSKGVRVKEFDDEKLAKEYLKKNKFELMY